MITAGTPPTTALSGTSFTTTALAPTKTLLPICISPSILAPAHRHTLSPNRGARPPNDVDPSYIMEDCTIVPNFCSSVYNNLTQMHKTNTYTYLCS